MTSTTAPIEGLTRLKQIDPEAADITNILLRLVDGETFVHEDGVTSLSASVEKNGFGRNPVFKTQAGFLFQINRLASKPLVITTDRVREAAEAIDQLSPLLDHLETVLGVALEPVDLDHCEEAPPVLIHVTAQRDDGLLDQIVIAGDTAAFNLTHMGASSRGRSAHPRDIPVLFDTIVIAATLPVEEAADLSHGDMILIGQQASATLSWSDPVGGELPVRGRLDLTTGHFIALLERDDAMASEPQGFGVPITITLPTRTTSAESLAGLKPGAVLPIGPISAGLHVDILVGGRSLAQGELVQVGDHFAVLIDGRASLHDTIPREEQAQSEIHENDDSATGNDHVIQQEDED